MTRISVLLASVALSLATAGVASADCAADIAALRANDLSATGSTAAGDGKTTNFEAPTGSAMAPKTGPIVQDGTTAPLEPAGAAAKTTESSAMAAPAGGGTTTTPGQSATPGKVVQDGTTAPLAPKAGSTDPQVATSAQDSSAQQAGAATAATTGKALDAAQKAADAGDEAACRKALETIKG